MKRCERCGKRWCGTNHKLKKLYPLDYFGPTEKTYGSKKCRRKGPKR